jgi:hypothetical protein
LGGISCPNRKSATERFKEVLNKTAAERFRSCGHVLACGESRFDRTTCGLSPEAEKSGEELTCFVSNNRLVIVIIMFVVVVKAIVIIKECDSGDVTVSGEQHFVVG